MCWLYFTLSVQVSDSLFSWSNFWLNKSLIHQKTVSWQVKFTILMFLETLYRFSGLQIKVCLEHKNCFLQVPSAENSHVKYLASILWRAWTLSDSASSSDWQWTEETREHQLPNLPKTKFHVHVYKQFTVNIKH